MKEFNDSVKKIIEKLSYEFYVVQQFFKIDCPCMNFATKQADPSCKLCLGLGKKIKIKKIKGASEDKKANFRNEGLNETSTSVSYYIDAKYNIYEKNMIVDDGKAYVVYRLEEKKTAKREIVYRLCLAQPKKSSNEIFMKNFNNIIGRA